MDPTLPPYIPAPLLITSSRLTAPELVSHFQDFSNNLRYVSIAPELVFERLVANLSDSLNTATEVGWAENLNLQASQIAYEKLAGILEAKSSAYDNLAASWHEKSDALQASQLANADLAATLEEKSSALGVSLLANAKFSAELEEKSSVLRASQRTIESLVTKLKKATGALQLSQLATQNLAAVCQENSNALQASELANKKIKDELAMLKKKIPAPGPSKLDTVKALVKRNPVIGTFGTSEIRSSQQPQQRNSKTVTFANKYAMVPGLVIGLTLVDIARDSNIRINAYASEIQSDKFKINLDTWDDTKKLYGAACAWLAIEADDPDFQYGSYHTIEDHDWTRTPLQNTRKIIFKRAYHAAPTVVVWLSVLDFGNKANWRIKTFATYITTTGFTIHIDTWGDTKLFGAMASWVAYPANRLGVASGSFSTRSSGQPQVYNSAFEAFGSGVFVKQPRIFMALNAFDIDRRQNMRLLVKADNVSAAGMTWHLNAWTDTTLYSAGASYIAFS